MKNYGKYSDNKDISTKEYDISEVSFPTINNARYIQLTRAKSNLTCLIPQWNQDTTGNAGSATRLAASDITLWGRPFTGESSVSGAISNTNSITPSATEQYNIGSTGTNGKRYHTVYAVNGNYTGSMSVGTTLSVTQSAEVGTTLSVVGNTGLGTAADSSNRLSVSGNTQMDGVLNITGVTGYAQGIRIHPNSGTSSIWFGATNATGFDAGMWGITVDTTSSSTSFRIRGTAAYDSTKPVDYVNILNGGNVGIGTSSPTYKLHVSGTSYVSGNAKFGGYVGINADASTSYRLYVNGDSYLKGKTYIGSTTYYLYGTSGWSYLPVLNLGGVMGSSSTHKLYVNGTSYFTGAITVGSSSTATFTGDTSVTSITPLSVASTIANTTAAFKVSGGAAIGGSLSVLGKRIYLGYHNSTSYYIELDGNGYLHTNAGFYSDSWIASGGIGSAGGSGGGGVNVNTYAQIQAGTATGVASENNTYVPTSYALRQVYNTTSGLSTTVAGLRTGNTDFSSIVIQKTNNSPTVTFRGEYNGTAGANIILGTISGYKQTISSVAYTGLSVSSDFFVPNGKHIYTFTYGGAVRSVVYYPTANYNELRFGDSAGATRIYGSSINLGETSSHSVNITGVTNITNTTDATGSSTAALKVSGGAYIGTSLIVGSTMSIQGSSVSISGATTFNSAVTIDSNSIGGNDHLIFNRNGINYIRASHADGNFIFISNGKTISTSNSALRINQYGISIKTSTAPSSSYALRVNGNSILSGTLTVGGYSVKGKKTYDLTTLFTKNSGTAIDTIGDSSVEGFLNDICNGYATLFTTEQKTFNGTAFSPRFDVHVAYMQNNYFALYYARMGGTPSMYFEVIEITYNSGWKISTRKTVTLN